MWWVFGQILCTSYYQTYSYSASYPVLRTSFQYQGRIAVCCNLKARSLFDAGCGSAKVELLSINTNTYGEIQASIGLVSQDVRGRIAFRANLIHFFDPDCTPYCTSTEEHEPLSLNIPDFVSRSAKYTRDLQV